MLLRKRQKSQKDISSSITQYTQMIHYATSKSDSPFGFAFVSQVYLNNLIKESIEQRKAL